MKTRIKIKEYNAGRKEYLCENLLGIKRFLYGKVDTNYTIIYLLLMIYFIFGGKIWLVMQKEIDFSVPLPDSQDAIFSTEHEAKFFIDDYLEEKEKEKEKEHAAKVKSTNYLKYP